MKSFFEKRIYLIPLALFLLAAPAWAPFCQVLKGRRLFLTADSMVWLGAALLAGFFCQYLLPCFTVHFAAKRIAWIRGKAIWLLLLLLIPATLAGLFFLNQKILHAFMNSADEHSCLFLAECLRLGRFWVEPPPLSEFFNVVHVGNKGGHWFSVYPPGWPLLLALALEWNLQDLINPVLTVISLFFLYLSGRKVYGAHVAFLSLLLLVLTPFFTFTGAAYFSHNTCLLAMAILTYAFLRWRESQTEQQRLLWAVIAAFAIGYGLITRYLTMAVFALPLVFLVMKPVILRKEKMKTEQWAALLIILVFFAVIFYQNYTVTGKLHKAPNRYDKSWERLGFQDDYTPLDGIIFILARAFYLMDWAPPVYLILYLASFFQKRERTFEEQFLQWAFLMPVAGYFLYFSWGGNQYGPRYYYEGFPFMMMSMLDGVRYWWRRQDVPLRKFLLGVFLVSLGASAYFFDKHGRYFEAASRERKALYALAEEQIQAPAIVFIRGMFIGQTLVMSQDDAIRNHPVLRGKVVYARDMGEKNQELRAYFPHREFYVGYFDRELRKAFLEKMP